MARVNISIPDQLYQQVKVERVPVSQVCQRALRDEIARRKAEHTAKAALLWHGNQPGGSNVK